MGLLQTFDRRKGYFQEGEYVKSIDYEGNWFFYRIARSEPLGTLSMLYASPDNKVGPPPTLPTTLAPGANTGWFRCNFLKPPAENRLYQVRPYMYMALAMEVEEELGPVVMYPYGTLVPAMIKVRWRMPVGTSRGGTDDDDSVTMNGITEILGGSGGGYMTPHTIPLRNDMSEFFDIFTMYGANPEFEITNDSPLTLGDETLGAVLNYDFYHYLGFTGMKYMLVEITEREKAKLMNHEAKYKSFTIGGIPLVTTKV